MYSYFSVPSILATPLHFRTTETPKVNLFPKNVCYPLIWERSNSGPIRKSFPKTTENYRKQPKINENVFGSFRY